MVLRPCWRVVAGSMIMKTQVSRTQAEKSRNTFCRMATTSTPATPTCIQAPSAPPIAQHYRRQHAAGGASDARRQLAICKIDTLAKKNTGLVPRCWASRGTRGDRLNGFICVWCHWLDRLNNQSFPSRMAIVQLESDEVRVDFLIPAAGPEFPVQGAPGQAPAGKDDIWPQTLRISKKAELEYYDAIKYIKIK